MTLDDIRAQHPDIRLGLYALTPGEPVTLEMLTADGRRYQFHGATVQAAIDAAFPPEPEPDPQPEPPAPTPSVFD
ncbi:MULTISPECIES: hypothetical protein [unclassified Aurantimonas]|uniref:hypothetical protein n=1 Tax=unclassified Aurantimonas TaxID=2638230 RepID=UPI002E19F658|nr:MULTISPECIES: hypothetical protein [unclassified Aurantimonas]MEC5291563.1 hypothetical protein [Aurantimonas sp. C2-3-R2]MEC5412647.1 hypothetical protein [Aurantimonas sp. C2-4-R8]